MKKMAVFFPGIGYTNDKPLLYYSAKLAKKAGYGILRIEFHGFPEGILSDPERIAECFSIVTAQTSEALRDTDLSLYDEVLFCSKSIGTIAAAMYAQTHGLSARQVYFTPLQQTLPFVKEKTGIAFHGTSDPWAETAVIRRGFMDKGIPLHIIEGANHSLETGDISADLDILKEVLEKLREYLSG